MKKTPIRIDSQNLTKFTMEPIDLFPGLREKGEETIARACEELARKIDSRFCSICFFGHVECCVEGYPMCMDCLNALYALGPDCADSGEADGRPKSITYRRLKSYEWEIGRRRRMAYEFAAKQVMENIAMKNYLREKGIDPEEVVKGQEHEA